jgi:hypothetical protein
MLRSGRKTTSIARRPIVGLKWRLVFPFKMGNLDYNDVNHALASRTSNPRRESQGHPLNNREIATRHNGHLHINPQKSMTSHSPNNAVNKYQWNAKGYSSTAHLSKWTRAAKHIHSAITTQTISLLELNDNLLEKKYRSCF